MSRIGPKRVAILTSSEPRDLELRDALVTHLIPRARGTFELWHADQLLTGESEIRLGEHCATAHALVVLLTPDLLADDALVAIVEGVRARGAPLVPVLGRACD